MILYKEYEGQFEYNIKSDSFKGRVPYIEDNILFEGKSVIEIKQSFYEAVNTYLKKCEKERRKPNAPIKSLRKKQKHDESYKNLFTYPEMIKILFEENWVKNLDYTTLEKMNNEFIVGKKLQRRANDIVWKIKYETTLQTFYLYILLEFQSKPDTSMPIRLDVYSGLLHLELQTQKKLTKSDKLSPILPLVLYNGKEKWNIATNIQDIVIDTNTIPDLKKYQTIFWSMNKTILMITPNH